MKCQRPIVCMAGLAMTMAVPCAAQNAAPTGGTVDASNAHRAQLAADIAHNTNALVQESPRVKVTGQLQMRYTLNARDAVPNGEETTSGMHFRRAKVKFSGKVSDELSYKVNGVFTRSTGAFILEDAYVDYKAASGLKIRSGQFKLPFMREELVSSTKQLAAERSITNEFFNQNRSQGVEVSRTLEKVRWQVAVSDGLNTINTDFTSSKEADFGLTGRVEYLLVGTDWARFKDFTSWEESDYTVMIGAAATYESGGETFATADTDLLGITADVSAEGDGWNVFVSGNYQNVEPAMGADMENWGFVVHGGYMLNPTWEAFGRYDVLLSDLNDDFNTITVGVNHYLIPESHAAKMTADVQYFLDAQSTSDAPTSTGSGLLTSAQDNQWVLRVQFQLLF